MGWVEQISPQINNSGRGVWPQSVVEAERRLYDHQFVYVGSGLCRVELSGKEYDLKSGSWIIIPPNTAHRSTALSDNTERFWVHFDWKKVIRKARIPHCVYLPQKPDPELIKEAPSFVPGNLKHSLKPENGYWKMWILTITK